MFRKWHNIPLCFLVLAGFCLSTTAKAQEVEFKLMTTLSDNLSESNGCITVSLIRANLPCTAYLYDKAPWKGGIQLRKTENIQAGEFAFERLTPGDYYIIVEDRDRNPGAATIRIDNLRE